MKKLIVLVSATLIGFLLITKPVKAETIDYTETKVVELEIEVNLNEMNEYQTYKLFETLESNNFLFHNGEYKVDTINNFTILKPELGILDIRFNSELIVISTYGNNYDFLDKTYNGWIYLKGDLELLSGVYDSIYNQGYENGYIDGIDYGEIEGFEDGYQAGAEEGYNAGYDYGVSQGENKGFTDGYEEGLNRGFERGHNEGYEKGATEGILQGQDTGKNFYGKYYNGEWITADEYGTIKYNQALKELGNVDDNKIGLIGFIPTILGTIGAFFFTLASFSVLGVSLLDIIALIVSVSLITLVIKLIKGGD